MVKGFYYPIGKTSADPENYLRINFEPIDRGQAINLDSGRIITQRVALFDTDKIDAYWSGQDLYILFEPNVEGFTTLKKIGDVINNLNLVNGNIKVTTEFIGNNSNKLWPIVDIPDPGSQMDKRLLSDSIEYDLTFSSVGEISELGFSSEGYVFGKQSSNPLCQDDEDQPIICPECVPNPAYQEPDINNFEGVYYNEATCEYCIILDPPRPTKGSLVPTTGINFEYININWEGDVEDYVKKAKIFDTEENLDVDTVLRYSLKKIGKEYNKSQSNEFYNPDSIVAEMPLSPNVKIEHDWTINTQGTEGTLKIKVCIPKRYLENIPEDDSSKGDYEEGQEELIIDADKWYGTMLRLAAGVKVYKKFYELHLSRSESQGYLTKADDPNKIAILPKDIKQLHEDVKELRKEIRSKATEGDYYLNIFATAPPYASKKIDKIKIKFNSEDKFYIKSIFVKSSGACDYERVYKQGEDPKSILNVNKVDSRIINPHAFLSNLEAIDDLLQAEKPPPWHEFFTTYASPQLIVDYNKESGLLDSQNQGNALACAMDKFPSFQDLLLASIGSLEEIFELLAYEWNKILCSQDTDGSLEDFLKRYPDENFPSFNDLISEGFENFDDDSLIKKLFDSETYKNDADILAALTFCELDTLFGKTLECLLGGIPFDKALEIIVKSLVSSLSLNHLGKLFGFLPISKQQEIQSKVQTIINATPQEPWANTSALTPSEDKSVAQSTKMSESYKDGNFNWQATYPSGSSVAMVGNGDITKQQVQQAGEEGKLSQATGVLVQAYIDALFDSIGFDELIGYLDNLPISFLIRGLLATIFPAYCPTTPLTDLLDIGQLIPKFKIDVCDANVSVHFPVVPDPSIADNWHNTLLKQLQELIVRITISVFTKLILSIIKQILQLLEDLLCSLLGAIGSAAFGGNLNDLISSYMCDDETADDLIPELMNNIGITPEKFDPEFDIKEASNCFERAISRTMSQREIINAVIGRPLPNKVYDMVSKSVKSSCPEIGSYFSDPDSIKNFLEKVGDFMTPEAKNLASTYADSLIADDPACDVVCMSQEQLAIWDGLRNNNLQSLGLSPEEASKIVDDANQKALDNFADMLDKASNLQDIVSDEFARQYGVSPINPSYSPEEDPSGLKSLDNAADNCKPYNPITDLTPELEANSGNISDFALKQLENCFYAETTGKNKSSLSKILSSNEGVVFNKAVRRKDQTYPAPGKLNADFKEQMSKERLFESTHRFSIKFIWPGEEYYFFDRIRNYVNSNDFYYHQLVDKKSSNEIIENVEIINDYNGNLTESFNRVDTNLSYSEELFYTLIKNKSNLKITQGYDEVANNLFAEIQKIMVVNNEEGFTHGYQEQDDLSDLTFEYLRPDGGNYDYQESDKVLGIPNDNEKDKIVFLDPATHGGSYTKPKIYLIPKEASGWYKVYKTFVDIDDPCGERIDGPIPFRELKEFYDDLVKKLPFDKRLYQDEDCRLEVPFDRISTPQIKALTDTLVRATIQVYMIKNLIPSFTYLQQLRFKNNYDLSIAKVIFNDIKREMVSLYPKRTKNLKFIRSHRYWYIFLEQVVQAYISQVQLGQIEPTDKERESLKRIKNIKKFYRTPTKEKIKKTREWINDFPEVSTNRVFNYEMTNDDHEDFRRFYAYSTVFDDFKGEKPDNETVNIDKPRTARFKRFKLQLKCYAISRVEEDCERLFYKVFEQELDRFEEKLNFSFKPQIQSIHEYLFNNSFFQGSSLNIGTYAASVSNDYPAGKVEELDLDNPIEFEVNGSNFVVQKYVRVVENNLTPSTERIDVRDKILLRQGTRNKGVTTLKEFKEIFTSFDVDTSEKLSYYFGKRNTPPAYFGIRILYRPSIVTDGVGLNAQVLEQNPNTALEKAYYYKQIPAIPLVDYELPFEDEIIGTFLSENSVNFYDDYCLIKNLIKTEDYKLFFKYIFPVNGYTSGFAISAMNAFVESVNFDKPDDDEEFPELEEIEYKKTKRALRRIFVATYNDQDFEDEQEDNEEDKRSLLEFLKNLVPKFSLGVNDLFGNRIVKELDTCDDPLKALLKKDE